MNGINAFIERYSPLIANQRREIFPNSIVYLERNKLSKFSNNVNTYFMYLHSAELNVVAVTENVNTFLLV